MKPGGSVGMRLEHSMVATGMRISVVLLALLVGGCSTVQVGRDFDVRAFEAQVQRGRTTEAQVRQWLGPPSSTGVEVQANGQRLSRWLYYYGKGKLSNMSSASLKMLEVDFNSRGIVSAYNWSE